VTAVIERMSLPLLDDLSKLDVMALFEYKANRRHCKEFARRFEGLIGSFSHSRREKDWGWAQLGRREPPSGGHGIRTRNRLPGTSFPVHRLPANRLRMVL